MKLIIFVCCLAMVWSAAAAEPEPRVVGVLGEGEVKSPADRAVVTLRLTAESRSLQEALKANQTLRTKVVTALTGRGIAADRIDAGKFSSTPRHWIFSDKVKSYKVENSVRVTVSDEKELQETARVLEEFSGVEFVGMEFEHSRKNEMKSKAVAQALETANTRKKVYEEQLGIALTPYKFTEKISVSGSKDPRVYRESELRSLSQAVSLPEVGSGFGEQVFTAEVLVQYTVSAR